MASRKFLVAVLGILLLLTTSSIWAEEEKPIWIKHWEEWVEKTGNEEWAKWLGKISKPEAIELGKAWAEYLGYNVVTMVLNSKKAPDVQPGLVITSENYKNFPGLKELLPEPVYSRLAKDSYGTFPEIKIVPTTHYYQTRGRLEATRKNEGKSKIDPEGMLVDWKGGVPFPWPKNGAELIWDFDRTSVGADNLFFNPIDFWLFDKNNKLERTIKASLWWQHTVGRCDLEPLPHMPGLENVYERGSIVFLHPFDVRGFAAVRIRFIDPEKPDYFITWVPSLRRTRLFSGTDSQDPMFGTDVPWDDWRAIWQKLSSKIYPNEYKLIEETEILAPVQYYPLKIVGNKIYLEWERYPCWVVEVKSKDSSYQYSKRLIWIEKGIFDVRYIQYFDRRGNLWRSWLPIKQFNPLTGAWSWYGGDVMDHINKHRTVVKMDAIPNDPTLTEDNFNLRALVRMAR